jgi:lipoprotein-releasing system permease protein
MFKPLSIYIGLRYTRAKRRQQFISVISLISMLCFALAVTALITVLSVMNGFDETIRHRIFSMAPQINVTSYNNAVTDWQPLGDQLKQFADVMGDAPYIAGQGMLSHAGRAYAALVFGILPDKEQTVSELGEKMVEGKLDDLQPGKFGLILGEELAASLGARIGDKLALITPQAAFTVVGMVPRFKRFDVVGIFHIGNGFGFDTSYAYIHLNDAQKLYQMADDEVSGIRLKLNDLYQAPRVAENIRHDLPAFFQVSNWTEQYGAFFQAIALEKTMLFLILSLFIVVAGFSLISSLYMLVQDKQADIAILRTVGATPGMIMRIFITQGVAIGLLGTIVGLIGGVLLSLNVTKIVDALQSFFNVTLLSSNVYYTDHLPSKIALHDIVIICGISLLGSFLATIIPALRAAKVQPAEALRYE